MEFYAKLKQFSARLFKTASEESEGGRSLGQAKYRHIPNNDEVADLKADLFKFQSIDEILDKIGLRWFHLKVFLLLGLLNITDSLEVSVLSIILPSIKSDWNISSLLAGLLTISTSIGMMIGSWFWGWVADKYGRKRCFVGSAIFILLFAFASVFSPNYYWLWISLFFVGFGIASIVQTYVMAMELFPPKYRSTFATLSAAFWTLGFLLSAIVSLNISENGYSWTLGMVCFPTALFLIGIIFFPDTPHYHLVAGDEQKALNIFQNFAPEMDFSNVKLSGNPESKRADISQLFRSGYWKITIGACIATFTCVMEYYVLVYMASDIASSSNHTTTSKNEELGMTWSGDLYSILAWMNLAELVIVIAVAASCYFITIKRVYLPTFLLSIILQIIALFVSNRRVALLVVTMLSRSLVMSATTLILIYASLLYPTANRGIGVGACAFVGRVGVLLGPFAFETVFFQAYFYCIVFNIAVLLMGFLATVLLPSRNAALD